MSQDMKKPGAASPGNFRNNLAAGEFSTSTVQPRLRVRQQLADNPFGLTLSEVLAEVRRCAARGWQLWEIRARFTPPEQPLESPGQPASRLREAGGRGRP